MTKLYKMPNHESANCRILVVEENGILKEVSLISYQTKVCGIIYSENFAGSILYCNGLYSATTRKHIGYFCNALRYLPHTGEYNLNYYTFKSIYGTNSDTGENRIRASLLQADYFRELCRGLN